MLAYWVHLSVIANSSKTVNILPVYKLRWSLSDIPGYCFPGNSSSNFVNHDLNSGEFWSIACSCSPRSLDPSKSSAPYSLMSPAR